MWVATATLQPTVWSGVNITCLAPHWVREASLVRHGWQAPSGRWVDPRRIWLGPLQWCWWSGDRGFLLLLFLSIAGFGWLWKEMGFNRGGFILNHCIHVLCWTTGEAAKSSLPKGVGAQSLERTRRFSLLLMVAIGQHQPLPLPAMLLHDLPYILGWGKIVVMLLPFFLLRIMIVPWIHYQLLQPFKLLGVYVGVQKMICHQVHYIFGWSVSVGLLYTFAHLLWQFSNTQQRSKKSAMNDWRLSAWV